MKNTFEALLGLGGKKKIERNDTVEQKQKEDSPELEKATNIKKEISEITQGKNLDDLAFEDLKAVLAKYKEIVIVLEISEMESLGDAREQIKNAKEILGEKDVLGIEELEKAFGIKIKPEQVPNIPFSKEDLERAKELNQFLILRVDKFSDGKPLTMEKMNEIIKGKVKDETKALYSDDGSGKIKDDAWYKSEAFALKETPKLSWALTSKEIIPDSTSKNYLQQTEVIVNYLRNDVFKGRTIPKEYQEAIKEFTEQKEKISKLVEDDWQEATKILEELQITKLTRQTPTEALYDILVYFQNNEERLLENKYTWTSRRASVGRLVPVGYFDADGASVPRNRPHDSDDNLGVAFSRSL